MNPATQQLRLPAAHTLPVMDGHPHHAFVETVLACRRCMGVLHGQLERRRDMDVAEAVVSSPP